MGYRETFIKAYPGVQRWRSDWHWYRCAFCGRWCARPGRLMPGQKNPIPENMRMEVDHIRPWSEGGSDELYNLQATCKPCNRAKSNRKTVRDSAIGVRNAVFHPIDTFVKAPIRKAGRKSKILKTLGITKRK